MLPVKVSIVLNLTIRQLQIVILYNFHADSLRPVPGLTSPATLLRSLCHWCRDLQRMSLRITVDVLGTVRNSPNQTFSGARLKRMLYAHAMSVQAHRRCSVWGFISYSFGDKSDEAGCLALFCVNHPLPTCSLKVWPTPTPHSLYVKGDSQNSTESKCGDLIFELNVELVIWTLLWLNWTFW